MTPSHEELLRRLDEDKVHIRGDLQATFPASVLEKEAASAIRSLQQERDRLDEALHAANGICERALKDRDAAEQALESARAETTKACEQIVVDLSRQYPEVPPTAETMTHEWYLREGWHMCAIAIRSAIRATQAGRTG